MTREEWRESITTFGDLIDWCQDNDVYQDEIDCILCEDTYNEYVETDIRDFDWGWHDLLSRLEDLPTGYDWYRRVGYFDYEGLSDDYDLENWIDDLEGYLDNIDWEWDGEEQEEGEEPHGWQQRPAARTASIFEEVPEEPDLEPVGVDGLHELSELMIGAVSQRQEPEAEEIVEECADGFSDAAVCTAGWATYAAATSGTYSGWTPNYTTTTGVTYGATYGP